MTKARAPAQMLRKSPPPPIRRANLISAATNPPTTATAPAPKQLSIAISRNLRGGRFLGATYVQTSNRNVKKDAEALGSSRQPSPGEAEGASPGWENVREILTG